jgi:hypothetical protein
LLVLWGVLKELELEGSLVLRNHWNQRFFDFDLSWKFITGGSLMLKLSNFHISLAPLCYVVLETINWLIGEKNELILWKWSSIWIKILNDAAYNLNWVKFDFNWNSIQFNLDLIKIYSNTLNSIWIQ